MITVHIDRPYNNSYSKVTLSPSDVQNQCIEVYGGSMDEVMQMVGIVLSVMLDDIRKVE